MTVEIVREAAALIGAGKMAEAQARLEPFIEVNPHNIPAWLCEAETWPAVGNKAKVLELGLQHNPGDPQLLSALAAIQGPPVTVMPGAAGRAARSSAASLSPARRRRIMALTLLGGVLAAVVWVGVWLVVPRPACESAPKAGASLQVLFIGNSYTMVNDLPSLFAKLACSGGYRVQTGMAAEGGWTLAQHVSAAETLGKLNQQRWDFVVLQEQSQIPASPADRIQTMYPAVRQLVGQIRALKAQPILFMTWGHRDGWPEAGLPDYNAMQSQLSAGYLGVARELSVPVAPVGAAWQEARTQAPALNLWMDDGTHPNSAGTYLAACIFYAALFRQSPAGLPYRADLPPETAQVLQGIAADIVLKNPGQWYLH